VCTSFIAYRDKKVVGVFVRFRAPLHFRKGISSKRHLLIVSRIWNSRKYEKYMHNSCRKLQEMMSLTKAGHDPDW
jgi:hypothetical protein